MDKSQMHFAKWKKQDSEGYLLCGCIHMSFCRQQSYMAMENRSMVARVRGWGRVSLQSQHKGMCWGWENYSVIAVVAVILFLSQFYLLILLYDIVLVLPYIDMNLPWVCVCFPILNPRPTSLTIPSLWVIPVHQPQHPVSCIEPGLAIHFTYDNLHVSVPFSHIIPLLPSPTESKRLFYTSVSLLLYRIQGYRYHLSKFHIYALVYCIGVFLAGLLH